MPTYDYKCNACGHTFEQFQGMKDKLLRTCPNCGKKALERLIGTGAAIVFKGSGFYQTDYRSENYKKAKEADTKPAVSETRSSDVASSAKAAEPTATAKAPPKAEKTEKPAKGDNSAKSGGKKEK